MHPRIRAVGLSPSEIERAAASLGQPVIDLAPGVGAPAGIDAAVVNLAAVRDLPPPHRESPTPGEPPPPLVLLYNPEQPEEVRRAQELAATQSVHLLPREGDWVARLPLVVHAAVSAARLQRGQTEHLLGRITAFAEEKRRLDCAVQCMSDGLLVLDRAYRFDCSKESCPAHGSGIFPCWLYDGTRCHGDGPDRFPDKLESCYSCAVYERNARVEDPARVRGRREIAVERPARKALQSLSAPVLDERGQFLGVVKLLRDVTTERLLEQVRAEFTSFVTHELRTPLTSILGFLQLVLRGREGEIQDGQRRKLEVVLREAKRLDGLVSNLLDIAAIESGRFTLQPRRFDLVPTLVDAVELLRVQAAGKGIELHLSVPDQPLVVVADRERITQVLTNLIGNAIHYSGERATVTTGAWVADNGVAIQVADTGPGIPADDIPRLFSKFYRVRSPAPTASRGSGLGLAICKGIVDAHGGRIWVESAPGQGSRFAFTIPPRQEAGLS